jgi:hypothetical protein
MTAEQRARALAGLTLPAIASVYGIEFPTTRAVGVWWGSPILTANDNDRIRSR